MKAATLAGTMTLCLLAGCGGTSAVDSTTDTTADTTATSSQTSAQSTLSYKVVDTNQQQCFDSNGIQVSCSGSSQDGEYPGNTPSYTDNGDGTVTDNVTLLTWQQTPDTNGDGVIDIEDKMTMDDAIGYCSALTLAGYSDWRLPDIKTIYSLIDFSGSDVSGVSVVGTGGLEPFIDDTVFAFGYGDTSAGERLIDAQWATTTMYVSTTMNGDDTMFGLNLADGRIKGYGLVVGGSEKLFYVQCVRGSESYGQNTLTDNDDETVTDSATGLMWQKGDSAAPLDWNGAISYCDTLSLADHDDWRLPDAKELQSIIDYTRSPDTTDSAALDEVFDATSFTNEAGVLDWGYYWSSTTHKSGNGMGADAVYISFGRALGYMNGSWLDVHGAGAQRSDPKDISTVNTADSAYTVVTDANGDQAITHGPQGDLLRGNNYARCVRSAE